MKIKAVLLAAIIVPLFSSCFLLETVEFSSVDAGPVAIDDTAPVELTIDQNEGGTVYSFSSVTIHNLTHEWAADLTITITAPDGKTRTLVQNDGVDYNFNGDYTFVSPDSSDYPSLYDYNGTEVFSGTDIIPQTLRAKGRIEELTPSSMAGNWVLTITDDRALDDGTVTSFTVRLKRYKWW